jgi:hypothetical protein
MFMGFGFILLAKEKMTRTEDCSSIIFDIRSVGDTHYWGVSSSVPIPPCKTISVGNGVKSVVKSYRCFIPAKVWKYSLLAWHRFVFLVHNVTGLLKNLCYPPTCTIGVTIILSHDQHCTMCRCASLNTVPLSKKWSASYCAFSPYAQTKRNTIIYLATSELQ